MPRRRSRTSPTARRVLPLTWFLAVIGLIALAAQVPPTEDPAAEAQRLAHQNDVMEQELALAEGKGFYLVVRLAEGRASLSLEGATLQEYVVSGLSVGQPRVGFRSRQSAGAWEGVVWASGRLDPPREVRRPAVAIAGAESDSPSLVPPTPEEAYPVPDRYGMDFDGGLRLDVHVVPEADRGSLWSRGWAAFAQWASDAREALRPAEARRLRLRLELSREEADALYRTVPPDVQLLIDAGVRPSP